MASENFSDLMSGFKTVFKDIGGVISNKLTIDRFNIFLKGTIKSLNTTVKVLDKYLEKKYKDIGEVYKSTKTKGLAKVADLRDMITKTKDTIKGKGVKQYLKDTGLSIGNKVLNVAKGVNERLHAPPDESKEKVSWLDKGKDKLSQLQEKVSSIEKAIGSFIDGNIKDYKEAKKEIEEEKEPKKPSQEKEVEEEKEPKKSLWSKYRDKQDSRKKEVEEEKAASKEGIKSKLKNNWLGKILTGIMSLGGFLLKGIKGIMLPIAGAVWGATKFLGGFMLKGVGKLFTWLIPNLSSKIASGLQSVIGNLLKIGGQELLQGAKAVGAKALPFLGKAAGLAVKGAGMILSGPIGWGIAIGGAIYTGYKLYKYLTRNDVSDDIYGKLTRLRLLMYGFNDTNKEDYSKLFDLEMLMKDFIKFDGSTNRLSINKLTPDIIEKINKVFNVDKTNKEQKGILNKWFTKRFLPAYRAFVEALYSVNNGIYLDSLEALKPDGLSKFIERFKIPVEIYDCSVIPGSTSKEIIVTNEEIDTMYTNIINNIKSNNKTDPSKQTKKLQEENKALADKQKQDIDKATAESKLTDKPVDSKPTLNGKDLPTDKEQEGEEKPKDINEKEVNSIETKVSDKLKLANGNLIPGGISLEGITTKLDKEKIYNLDPNVRELFTGMAKEYNSITGKNVPVTEAFRSYEDQMSLFKKYPDRAATPGNSVHEYGLAVDVPGKIVEELNDMGLLRKYGFTTSVGGEKWHIEPIGVSLNPTAAKKDPNFRSSAVLASPGRGGGGYGLVDNSKLKKRNYGLQQSIYNSSAEQTVDINKLKEETPTSITNTAPKTLGEVNKKLGEKINNQNKPTEAMMRDDNVETETKPSMPTTSTPIKSKEETPTLNTPNNINPDINKNMDLAKYANLEVIPAIKQASKMTGVNEDTLISFAKIESSLNPNAKASTSSAGGLFQITDPTWNELANKYGKKYGFDSSADKFNPLYNSLIGAEYGKQNIGKLSNYEKVGLNDTSAMYLAHHFGPSGANNIIKVASSTPDAPMTEAVSSNAYKANINELKGKTIDSYINYLNNKLNTVSNTPIQKYRSSANKSDTSVSNVSESQENTATNSTVKPIEKINKPTISTSSYSNTNPSTKQTSSEVNSTYSNMFNSSNIETLLNNQIKSLTDITSILTSINDKIDLDKVISAFSQIAQQSDKNQTQIPSINKSIPPINSVNLSRKNIQI